MLGQGLGCWVEVVGLGPRGISALDDGCRTQGLGYGMLADDSMSSLGKSKTVKGARICVSIPLREAVCRWVVLKWVVLP